MSYLFLSSDTKECELSRRIGVGGRSDVYSFIFSQMKDQVVFPSTHFSQDEHKRKNKWD